MVGYKSQVRSDPPIIFLPIINFIFVIISKLRIKCPVYQFYIIIHCLINIRQKMFLFSMLLDLIFNSFLSSRGIKAKSSKYKKITVFSVVKLIYTEIISVLENKWSLEHN